MSASSRSLSTSNKTFEIIPSLFFQIRQEAYNIQQTITNVDHADDLVLLANTSAQAKSLLNSLEQAERGIDLYVNLDKNRIHVF